jgi:hypothetical protein
MKLKKTLQALKQASAWLIRAAAVVKAVLWLVEPKTAPSSAQKAQFH